MVTQRDTVVRTESRWKIDVVDEIVLVKVGYHWNKNKSFLKEIVKRNKRNEDKILDVMQWLKLETWKYM